MLSCEGVGKNIEQAINNALFELKATREDVDIKILDEGGFFRKAKVLVSISEDAIEKYQKVNNLKVNEQEKEVLEQPSENVCEQEVEKVEEVANCDQAEEVVCEKEKEDKIPDIEKAKTFVENLLKIANVTSDIVSEENSNEVFLNLVGASEIIGFRGEGLNAIQYLTNVYVGKNNRHSKKIRIDCDNYRAKREDTLIALANRMARKVAKMNHSVKLEPMTAYERRIIHSALADDKFVETFSTGEEPYRYLTISPKKK